MYGESTSPSKPSSSILGGTAGGRGRDVNEWTGGDEEEVEEEEEERLVRRVGDEVEIDGEEEEEEEDVVEGWVEEGGDADSAPDE